VEFETEEQQAEAVKKWFKEYGLTIIMGLVIGLGGMKGYEYYQQTEEQAFQAASDAYDTIINDITNETSLSDLQAKSTEYRAAYESNVYTNMLDLRMAKAAVDEKNLEQAESLLTTAMNEAVHPTLEHTARIRLARVQIALEKYEQALTTIAGASGDAYQYSYELLRGDVWLARGDQQKAKDAYEKAKTMATDVPPHPDLDMILADLASVTKPVANAEESTND
jgi:predicted negative regulator of RcsB-dependent stress response